MELALGANPSLIDSLARVPLVSQNRSKPGLSILDCFFPSYCESLGQQ